MLFLGRYKIEIFISNVILYKVMINLNVLRESEEINRIMGKVEIETIIKKINGITLKQVERNYLSRSIRPKLIGSALLTQQNILGYIQKSNKIKRSQIIFNLNRYGYELISSYSGFKSKNLKLEILISYIISEFPESRFIEGIPILLLKNKINPYLLLEIAANKDIKNQVGYLLETSFIIAKKFKTSKNISYLKELLQYLEKNKGEERILGKETDDLYKKFLIETSPKRIKKWRLLGRYFDEYFIKTAEAYFK